MNGRIAGLSKLARVVEDISQPLEPQGGVVVEVNAGPGLVMHLIDHEEGGEALIALAWIAVENDRALPPDAIAAVRCIAADLGVEADLPGSFGQSGPAEWRKQPGREVVALLGPCRPSHPGWLR